MHYNQTARTVMTQMAAAVRHMPQAEREAFAATCVERTLWHARDTAGIDIQTTLDAIDSAVVCEYDRAVIASGGTDRAGGSREIARQAALLGIATPS